MNLVIYFTQPCSLFCSYSFQYLFDKWLDFSFLFFLRFLLADKSVDPTLYIKNKKKLFSLLFVDSCKCSFFPQDVEQERKDITEQNNTDWIHPPGSFKWTQRTKYIIHYIFGYLYHHLGRESCHNSPHIGWSCTSHTHVFLLEKPIFPRDLLHLS